MAEVFIYGLPLIALIAAAFLVYYFFPAAFPPFWVMLMYLTKVS